MVLFADVSEGSENGEGNEVAEDAEDDLVDPTLRATLVMT